MSPYAADLPGIEPTAADLAVIEHLSWHESQAHLEALLAESATTPVRRAVVSPIRHMPASTATYETEGRAAA